MIQTILVIIVIFVLMILVVFFITKNTVDSIKEKGKLYFALKLQEYEKNKEDKKENVIEEENNSSIEKQDDKENNQQDKTLVYIEPNNNYEIDKIFKIAKDIDNKFSLDAEQIIHDFINNKVVNEDESYFHNLMRIKEKINEQGLFNILTSGDSGVDEVIDFAKSVDEKIIDRYMSISGSFDINEFMNYVDSEIDKNNPTIYVFVGQEHVTYDNLDKRIKTIYKEDIYKGLKILYKNKLYDYSLS